MAQSLIQKTRTASASWNGGVPQGSGRVKTGSGALDRPFSFATRMGDEPGTNPEELIGAAHAGCFSMALAYALTQGGHPPTNIDTTATVHFGQTADGFAISKIDLKTVGTVPGIDAATFSTFAEQAKAGCPISKALAGVQIALDASLAG